MPHASSETLPSPLQRRVFFTLEFFAVHDLQGHNVRSTVGIGEENAWGTSR
jgi:hypothetical protein